MKMSYKEFIVCLELAESKAGMKLRENASITEIKKRMPLILMHADEKMLFAIMNDLIYRMNDGSTVEMGEFWKMQAQRELDRRVDEELLHS